MKKIKELWAEFKKFISRGNVVDMAVGVIIASAFTAIVTAVTSGILMPLVNWAVTAATGGQGLEGLRTVLGTPAYTIDEVTGAEIIDWASTNYIDWGSLINAVVDFILIAVILFTILKVFVAIQKMANDANSVDAKKKRKLIRANMKDGMSISQATEKAEADIAAEKKAEEEKKAAEEAAASAKPTTEELLVQIRDLLAAQNNNSEK
ncbi:MAG TPA: large conductance mechanosensitive channel protein MscL [Candidatus Coproplasma excrementipullorum]|nr:large conductance mechanosensitive channel protein MscL [Candidatus Coproplasma excrementipullorum]